MSVVKEFKEFAMRGSVVDLAVGVVIGGALGKIVSSLVADVIMPPIGYITGGVDFGSLQYALKPGDEPAGLAEVSNSYRDVVNSVIEFLIIAFCIFIVIKGINSLKRSEAAVEEAPAGPSNEEVLLAEIRDLLKSKCSIGKGIYLNNNLIYCLISCTFAVLFKTGR